MHSIHRNASKLNRLGPAKRHSLTDFQIAEVDTKVELIRALVPLGLMAACDMLEAEVEELVGAPYSRGGAYCRHGTNSGSVKLQGQRHRHQQAIIDYLMEENRIFKQQLQDRRLNLSDNDRRRLAAKAKALGRQVLNEVANLVTPDTLLA